MESLLVNIDQVIRTNPLLAFAAVFIAGVVVSFTPCVYPVIPLTLGAIGARSAGQRAAGSVAAGRWRGFLLSLIYVFGMALTYAVLGLFASLTGKLFGQVGSHPITYLFVANICLLMGLSMLGVFSIPQLSLGGGPRSAAGRGFFGIFWIGVVSGLIVGPCTAPALAAILVYVAAQHDVLYGFSLLFVFGYGVGFLLILLGTFTGLLASLPKSGAWLERVKQAFGWFLILAAEYLLIKAGGLLI